MPKYPAHLPPYRDVIATHIRLGLHTELQRMVRDWKASYSDLADLEVQTFSPKPQVRVRPKPNSRATRWVLALRERDAAALRKIQVEYQRVHKALPTQAQESKIGSMIRALAYLPLPEEWTEDFITKAAALPHPLPELSK